MAGNIFINYRRDESGHVAGRLHDSLALKFGRNKLFMDVDSIPVGRDFEEYLKGQVGACDAMLAVIGPDWLTAQDETGQRRLDNPEDFVVVEIAAALARNIPVVPVLVGEARMPKASELPDTLKPLARRQAFQIRQTNFKNDTDALVQRLREALGDSTSGPARWRVRTIIGVTAAVVLLLIGVGGYTFVRNIVERGVHQAELQWEQERSTAMAEANRKVEEAEQQRVKTEQERQRAAAEAEAKRKSDEAEQQRQAAVRVGARGSAYASKGDLDRAMTDYSEAIRLNPNHANAFWGRGIIYRRKGDNDRAITDLSEAVRLDPKNANAFEARGLAYASKGDLDRAMTDYSEAIRLNPTYANAFWSRGTAYGKKGDHDRAITDLSEAIRLDPKNANPFYDRGVAYASKGDRDRAITDYSEAIRLNPNYASAFYSRGNSYRETDIDRAITDYSEAIRLNPSMSFAFNNRGILYGRKGYHDQAFADFNEAIRLDAKNAAAYCNRGIAKLRKNDSSGNADKSKARELGNSCK